MTHDRARELIALLNLQPHPEGGHYRETYRAAELVQPADGRAARSALTSIYFLLARGEFSRWHRVASSEAWHWYEGDELELLIAPPSFDEIIRVRLGRVGMGVQPSYALAAGWWQAATAVGEYSLCGCSVGPGFDFADFSFLRDDARLSEKLRAMDAEAARLL